MKRSFLFMVTGDPRVSCKPAEALRIAAGVGVWEKVAVSIYFQGPAVLLLSERTDLVQMGDLAQFMQVLSHFHPHLFVEENSPFLSELRESRLSFEAIGIERLAELTVGSHCVLHF